MFVIIWRTVFLYFFIVVSLRFMGKRQLGELQPSELVITILISNIASIPIENLDASLINGVLSILILISFEVLSSALSLKSRFARRLIQGNPAFIIRDGEIDQVKMEQLRYSLDDLMEQLRAGGIFDISDVLMAVVETTGSLSVYPKAARRPLTPEDMAMNRPETPAKHMVICDGEVCDDGLYACGADREWLMQTLKKTGYEPAGIFLMTCGEDRDYNITPKRAYKQGGTNS